MEAKWKFLVYGVRGSVPVPGKDFLIYGGNTSCMALEYGSGLVIFDAGTGLLRLGADFNDKKYRRVDILLSHLHIDHLCGLFGFSLFNNPDMEIHFYGQSGSGIFEYLHLLVGKPFWPVSLKEMAAHIEMHEVMPGKSFYLAENKEIKVDTLQGNHPGGSLLYRVGTANKKIVYALDCEINETLSNSLIEFAADSDLVIWDAAYTQEDMRMHKGWGHSSWEQGICFRRRARAKRILMTHYSQFYTDDFLRQQEQLAKETDETSCFAKEGMVIEI